MARPLRIEYAGALYYVTSRGEPEEPVYLDDVDRNLWLEIFGSVCERFNWRCHAWVQMDNHFHIVIETLDANLSKGMRQLNGVYTQAFNRRHDRAGPVFHGRFKGILADKENYLLELSRYVVLNPLRAKKVKQLAHWRWSSYRSMTGKAETPHWLETDFILGSFGKQRKRAIPKYIEFVKEGKGADSVWDDKIHPVILGDELFIESVHKHYADEFAADVKRINGRKRKARAKSIESYFRKGADRGEAMAAAYKTGEYTLQEIADCCGVHFTTVSRALKIWGV